MAQNVIINGVTYSDVPEVEIPKNGGGTARFLDTGDADISPGDVLAGKTAFGANGPVSGQMPNNGQISRAIESKDGAITIPSGFTSGGSVSIKPSAVADLASGNLLTGKTVLGVSGSLTVPTVSQDSTTKVLSIS